MNKCMTTLGTYYSGISDPSVSNGPSMTREEQNRRLVALRVMKGKSEKQQKIIGERIFEK